jgi:hypothetical protein
LWCESLTTDHRWRLAFNLRALEADPLDESPQSDGEPAAEGVVIAGEALAAAERSVRSAFNPAERRPPAEALTAELETTLGHGKAAWPLATIRRLADVLIEVAAARNLSPAHEVRWMNLTGFCMRPGFGSAADPARVSELRKVYAAGLVFPKDIQAQAEWLVLWQRVSAGFTAGQQRELAQRVAGQLGIGGRKPPRLNPQIERESWRLLGALERLDARYRTTLGDEVTERIRRDPRNGALAWTAGRLGARRPLYGPLNTVVTPDVAEGWIERLLAVKHITPEIAAAVVQIGERTDDPARDLSHEAVEAARTRLVSAGFSEEAVRPLLEPVPHSRADAARVFGETLPEGLRLIEAPADT